jgi:hypothetical protein
MGIKRWHEEKWVDACEWPKRVPCGRKSARKSRRKYPYCRPSVRVNSKTPTTVQELSSAEIRRRCKSKRRNPKRRVTGSKSKRRKSKKR